MYNGSMNKTVKKSGFTLIELVVVLVFVSIALVLFFLQKQNLDAMHRDEQRKEAINAMYYALEEGFYVKNGYYPETITDENLTVMDPKLFTDPNGVYINGESGSLNYISADCNNGKCREYTLRARLEKEDDYIKKNRHN